MLYNSSVVYICRNCDCEVQPDRKAAQYACQRPRQRGCVTLTKKDLVQGANLIMEYRGKSYPVEFVQFKGEYTFVLVYVCIKCAW